MRDPKQAPVPVSALIYECSTLARLVLETSLAGLEHEAENGMVRENVLRFATMAREANRVLSLEAFQYVSKARQARATLETEAALPPKHGGGRKKGKRDPAVVKREEKIMALRRQGKGQVEVMALLGVSKAMVWRADRRARGLS